MTAGYFVLKVEILVDFVEHVDVVLMGVQHQLTVRRSNIEAQEHESPDQCCSVDAIFQEANDCVITLKNFLCILQQSNKGILRCIRQQTVRNLDVKVVVLQNRVPFEKSLRGQRISESNFQRLSVCQFMKNVMIRGELFAFPHAVALCCYRRHTEWEGIKYTTEALCQGSRTSVSMVSTTVYCSDSVSTKALFLSSRNYWLVSMVC